MKIVMTLVLALHGIAHLVGFLLPWHLMKQPDGSYTTTLTGGLDIGETGMKIMGIGWLIVALAFLAAAFGAWRHASWWPTFTLTVAIVSLGICLVNLPEAAIGIPIDIAIILVMIAGMKAGWSLVKV
jgi:hypothetical protein